VTKEELIEALRADMFASRNTIKEAVEYATTIVDTLDAGDRLYVYTAIHVIINTIANEIERMEN